MSQETINYQGIEMEVHFDYEPEEKQVWTCRNGDPGHPCSPEMYIITNVFVGSDKVDIIELLSETQEEEIIEQIKAKYDEY